VDGAPSRHRPIGDVAISAIPVEPSAAAAKAGSPTLLKPSQIIPKQNPITWMALAMMTTGSVASLRSAPTMAVFGLASVFMYLVAAIVFLLPTTFVAAELASAWPGGIYRWVTEAYGPRFGLLAIWCQFAMAIFYYPALLAYVASTFAYVIDPKLASNGLFTAVVIIAVFWAAVLISSSGMKLTSQLTTVGVIIGTLIPAATLVGLGVAFLAGGHTSAAPMNLGHILPAWGGIGSLVLIVSNFAAFSGMEMNAVHVSDLKDPPHEFPKAMWLGLVLVLVIYMVPAVAISWIVPASATSLTAGVMQAFTSFFGHFGVSFLVPVVGIMILVAMLGGMLCWLAGPSTGLMLIGREEGLLPPHFQKINARACR